MRIAIYARVSTKDKGQEVQNQVRQLREFCATQDGWIVVHEYIDHASGTRSDRQAFAQMFNAASRRQFDLLIFWSLDRFSREGVLETLQYLQRLTQYGVAFRSFTEPYLDSAGLFRDALVSIIASIAKQEKIRLSERTIAGLQRARAKGRIGGRPKVKCNHSQILDLRNRGASLAQIAAQLGLTKTTVHRILLGCQ
jgi:DNA invertase Pin-like site-specific DNA recombinase